MSKDELEIKKDGITSFYEFLDEMELLSVESPKGHKATLKIEFHQKTGESCEGDKNE